MKSLIIPLFLGIVPAAIAQVAINNTGALPNASSMLDISSTSRGLLVPRMTMAQRNAIANPATGLMIFQTDNSPGFYFNSGTTSAPQWTRLITGSDPGLGLTLPYNGSYSGDIAFSITNGGQSAIRASNTGDYGRGLEGYASGNGAAGVYGELIGSSGWGVGVYGINRSPDGIGVLGQIYNDTTRGSGVMGSVFSPRAIGVYGENLALTGTSVGIRGHVNSPDGFSGVFSGGRVYITGRVGIGIESAQAGLHIMGNDFPNSFLYLQSDPDKDAGIRFYEGSIPKWHWYNFASAGGLHLFSNAAQSAIFVKQDNAYVGLGTITPACRLDVNGQIKISGGSPGSGKVLTSNHIGLAAWQEVNLTLPYRDTGTNEEALLTMVNEATTGTGIIGIGGGTGISGKGSDFGVKGETGSGTAVYGYSSSGMGGTTGVYGESASSSGRGVEGRASSNSGSSYGVYGSSASTTGIGVYGRAIAPLGVTTGIKSEVSSPEGFSGWFNGGKFYVNGRAGFGTTLPGAGLHLKATGFPNSFMFLEAADNQDAGLRIYEGTLDQWHIFNSASVDGLHIYNKTGTTVFFAKQSNGFVGIGNTAPTQMLDVSGTIRVRGMGTGAVAGTVSRTADGTLITGSSDIRLKDDIQPLLNSLQKVLQLQGVSFRWKTDPQKRKAIGLVAQDLEKVFPELVFTNENDGYKGINYAELTAVLIEAIKELKTEVECLKAEVEKRRK